MLKILFKGSNFKWSFNVASIFKWFSHSQSIKQKAQSVIINKGRDKIWFPRCIGFYLIGSVLYHKNPTAHDSLISTPYREWKQFLNLYDYPSKHWWPAAENLMIKCPKFNTDNGGILNFVLFITNQNVIRNFH